MNNYKEELVNSVRNFLELKFENLKNYTILGEPGKIRAESGLMVENLIDLIWDIISKQYPEQQSEIFIGKKNPITISQDGETIQESVDRHCYINNELVLIIECKTYLDKCYFQRASDDFKLIKSVYPNTKTLVVSLENSIKKESFDFIKNKGYVDNVIYLADGKKKFCC